MNCNYCNEEDISHTHHCPFGYFNIPTVKPRMSTFTFLIYSILIVSAVTAVVLWRVL